HNDVRVDPDGIEHPFQYASEAGLSRRKGRRFLCDAARVGTLYRQRNAQRPGRRGADDERTSHLFTDTGARMDDAQRSARPPLYRDPALYLIPVLSRPADQPKGALD